jgi:hypothetical protein
MTGTLKPISVKQLPDSDQRGFDVSSVLLSFNDQNVSAAGDQPGGLIGETR